MDPRVRKIRNEACDESKKKRERVKARRRKDK